MTNLSPTVIWLQERTELGQLSPEVLTAIAAQLTEFQLAAGEPLLEAGEMGQAVYILRQGQLEWGSGKTCLLPVSYTHLTLPTKRIV